MAVRRPILLIEDNPVDAQLTKDILAEESADQFDLSQVDQMSEAIRRLRNERFDVVLLDLSLPDANGLETVHQIQVTTPNVPIVVLSGFDDKALALQAVQNGAQDYLVKGRSSGELLGRAIRYAIERKRAEERLIYLAQYDHLTGLVNRTLFRDRLTQPVGLMLLDLDGFKTVNDTLGHDIGDQLLKAAADRLKYCVREVDTVARMGGDEFTVLLEGASGEQDIAKVAERILEAIAKPLVLDGHTVSVTASIGITVYPLDDHDIDVLLRHADTAMYRAKGHGGNHYRFALESQVTTPQERPSPLPKG